MEIQINDKTYPVEITYKNIKNMYLRIKEGPKVVVTAPRHMPSVRVHKFVDDNIDYIAKNLVKKDNLKENRKGKFEYLGHLYDIIYVNERGITLSDTTAYINRNANINNWYKKEALDMFAEYYNDCFSNFEETRIKPTLKIRRMTSKWGVCNVTDKTITLNQELIKLDPICLEYVIYHELSHLVHPNHSKDFWNLVSKYVPNYKEIKKHMKNVY